MTKPIPTNKKYSIVDNYLYYLSSKFLNYQNKITDGYNDAITEIKSCRKNKHWIWYILPSGYYMPSSGTISNENRMFQLHNRRYIRNRYPKFNFTFLNEDLLVNEVELYLLNPILINRIYDISYELLKCLKKGISYKNIFPNTKDHPKLLSCINIFNKLFKEMDITLFHEIGEKLHQQGLKGLH